MNAQKALGGMSLDGHARGVFHKNGGKMHTGKIKKVVRERGFGFISDTDGREVFFHQSSLVDVTIDKLDSEQAVE
ncbi:cold-shock protein, partial [Candidatus Omnitrophota bacterium]